MHASAALPLQTFTPGMPAVGKTIDRLLQLKPSLALHHQHSPQRPALEAYIRRQFSSTYGATVTGFLPVLSSMLCQENISAVVGIRPAGDSNLFIEQYLNKPVEQVLNDTIPSNIIRQDIVEIGNLSATRRSTTLFFFILQVTMLHKAGFKWAVCAATDQVEQIMHKLNFATLDLGPADPARLGDKATHWGQYYETKPTVRAVDIAATVDRLRQSPLPATVITFFEDTVSDLAHSMKSITCQ